MLTTRGVLALLALGLMTAAVVATRRGREAGASWLMAAGFAVATLWTLLGVAWAYENPARSAVPWRSWAMIAPVAAVLALFYLQKAREREGLRG